MRFDPSFLDNREQLTHWHSAFVEFLRKTQSSWQKQLLQLINTHSNEIEGVLLNRKHCLEFLNDSFDAVGDQPFTMDEFREIEDWLHSPSFNSHKSCPICESPLNRKDQQCDNPICPSDRPRSLFKQGH